VLSWQLLIHPVPMHTLDLSPPHSSGDSCPNSLYPYALSHMLPHMLPRLLSHLQCCCAPKRNPAGDSLVPACSVTPALAPAVLLCTSTQPLPCCCAPQHPCRGLPGGPRGDAPQQRIIRSSTGRGRGHRSKRGGITRSQTAEAARCSSSGSGTGGGSICCK
jgi:hypothetical protein